MAGALERPRYFPYAGGRGPLDAGIRPLNPDEWIEPDEQLERYLADKDRLVHERVGDVLCTLPAGADGAREVLAMLAAHLPRRFPEIYRRDGDAIEIASSGRRRRLDDPDPLLAAGMLVQEDLCLLAPGHAGYELVAAFVCAPSHWRLADKIGRPLGAIHRPVPGYQRVLARSTDSLFARMKPERPLWRTNWTISGTTTLFQPERDADELERIARLDPRRAGDELFVRVERQTLRRLPVSGQVLFTIRVYIDPLSSVAAHPSMAADLLRAVAGLDDDQRAYKSLEPFQRPLERYLRSLEATS